MKRDLLSKYFEHLQDDKSARNQKFSPGYVTLQTRSFCVLIDACFPRGGTKNKRSRERMLEHVRALGKTVSLKRAQEGAGVPDVRGGTDLEEPLTVPQTVASCYNWQKKIKNLVTKISLLDVTTPKSNRRYMKYKLASLRAAMLVFGFIFQTTERLQTAHKLVLGRTLFWDEERAAYFTVPLGEQPRKTEKSKRMKRGYFVAKKPLSTAWSEPMNDYLSVDLPLLKKYFQKLEGALLQPPRREGEEAPFLLFDYDALMKLVGKVGRANVTEIRAAVEAFLLTGGRIWSNYGRGEFFAGFSGALGPGECQALSPANDKPNHQEVAPGFGFFFVEVAKKVAELQLYSSRAAPMASRSASVRFFVLRGPPLFASSSRVVRLCSLLPPAWSASVCFFVLSGRGLSFSALLFLVFWSHFHCQPFAPYSSLSFHCEPFAPYSSLSSGRLFTVSLLHLTPPYPLVAFSLSAFCTLLCLVLWSPFLTALAGNV
ncbi:unnamed protein product [Symbiodinium sp. CCMP2592]|nr:unnamed protein product [Symbiodinium sp. CCMP2592]